VTTHVALLRGINVGGHKQVAMADLRDLLAQLGLSDARTVLQSGNLVFRSTGRRTPAQLEQVLEREAEQRFGVRADWLVRKADEWRMIIARNPFREEAARDSSHLVVMLLKDAPSASRLEALQAAITCPEVVRADGRHMYIVYPNGIGRSRLTNSLIEKTLRTRGTGRNWNTVLKIDALANPVGGTGLTVE
jgi:uncharacterized protein (DUF1697 family)